MFYPIGGVIESDTVGSPLFSSRATVSDSWSVPATDTTINYGENLDYNEWAWQCKVRGFDVSERS
jgi:hypothetical protein